MMKLVLKVEAHDEKIKQRVMKAVSGLSGVDSIDMNMKDKKLTLTGDIDPVKIVGKLRKLCRTEILTVGPVKKEEPKKEEPKKADDKKKDNVAQLVQAYPFAYYNQYQPPPMNTYYYKPVVEEDPNGCVIC